MCLMLTACTGSGNDHAGEAKIPENPAILKGDDYKEVEKLFKDSGFTNIKFEKEEDLIVGFFTKEGEIESISVGGDTDFSKGKWVKNDTEVVIKYHAFSEVEDVEDETQAEVDAPTEALPEILTIDNCTELKKILTDKNADYDDYQAFAQAYEGKTIEFDGSVDYKANFKDRKTRFTYLLSYGDYNPDTQVGPTFKFDDVGVYELGLELGEELEVGQNIRITAKVENFDYEHGIFNLNPTNTEPR